MFIEIKNLSKKYKDTLAVDNIKFSTFKKIKPWFAWSKWLWENYIHWNDVGFNKTN